MKPDLHWILLMRGHQVTGTNHLWVQFASVMTRQNCIEFWCALSVVDVFFVLSISALIIPLLFCFITLCPVLLFLLFSVSLCLWSLWFPAHPSNSVQFCCIFLGGVLFCVARGGLAFYWNRITCFNVKIYIYFFFHSAHFCSDFIDLLFETHSWIFHWAHLRCVPAVLQVLDLIAANSSKCSWFH